MKASGTVLASTKMTSVSRQRVVASLALAVLVVAAIGFPLVFSSPVTTNYAIYALIFVAAVSAWNVFSGFSGYISLGNAVFFGSGAYTVGIAARDWHINGVQVFILLPLAAAVGAAIAVPFGLVALRVRRHTFIVITIAVFFIFQLVAYNLNSFTGGTVGCLGAVPALVADELQRPLLLHHAGLRRGHGRYRRLDPAVQVRPAAPGDQGR